MRSRLVRETRSPSISRIRSPLGFLSARNSFAEIDGPSRWAVRLTASAFGWSRGFFPAVGMTLQLVRQVVSVGRKNVRQSPGHNCIRGVEIKNRVGRGRAFIIENTSLPARQNQFRSHTQGLVTPVEPGGSAKRWNPRQRFVLFSKFRSHVIQFAT